jgi:hypothetical protein
LSDEGLFAGPFALLSIYRKVSGYYFLCLEVVFPPFALKQKVEPKIQGGRDRSARPAVPPHNNVSSQVVTGTLCTAFLDCTMWITVIK